MTVAGFLRVLTSGGLLLAATTTTLVGPADSSSSAEVCPNEVADCVDDATCTGCLILEDPSSEEFQTCGDDISVGSDDSSTPTCSDYMAGICCFDEASRHECTENDNFQDVWLCFLEDIGCSFDEITCDEDGDGTGLFSDAVSTVGHASIAAFTCALLVPFLPVL